MFLYRIGKGIFPDYLKFSKIFPKYATINILLEQTGKYIKLVKYLTIPCYGTATTNINNARQPIVAKELVIKKFQDFHGFVMNP